MILQIFQDLLFVELIEILLLSSSLYSKVKLMLNVYLLIWYVSHLAIPIRVHWILEHRVHKLMVELFQSRDSWVVEMKLVIVVE